MRQDTKISWPPPSPGHAPHVIMRLVLSTVLAITMGCLAPAHAEDIPPLKPVNHMQVADFCRQLMKATRLPALMGDDIISGIEIIEPITGWGGPDLEYFQVTFLHGNVLIATLRVAMQGEAVIRCEFVAVPSVAHIE